MFEDRDEPMPKFCVLVCSFEGNRTARHVQHELGSRHELHADEVVATAVVTHDADGRVHVHDPGAEVMGGTFGAVTAGVLGLVGGPVGLVAMVVAGGVIGGLYGHFAGRLLEPHDLRRIAEALPPDSSAVVSMVEDCHTEELAAVYRPHGARILTLHVQSELCAALAEALDPKTRHLEAGFPVT